MFNKKREAKLRKALPEFFHENKDLLIIVADPKTDSLFVAYKDVIANGTIKSPTGKKLNVVKGVLSASLFEDRIDLFITGLVETLKVPLRKGNQFFMFIDGAIFNIAKAIQQRRKPAKSATTKAAGEAIKSPFMNSSR